MRGRKADAEGAEAWQHNSGQHKNQLEKRRRRLAFGTEEPEYVEKKKHKKSKGSARLVCASPAGDMKDHQKRIETGRGKQ